MISGLIIDPNAQPADLEEGIGILIEQAHCILQQIAQEVTGEGNLNLEGRIYTALNAVIALSEMYHVYRRPKVQSQET